MARAGVRFTWRECNEIRAMQCIRNGFPFVRIKYPVDSAFERARRLDRSQVGNDAFNANRFKQGSN